MDVGGGAERRQQKLDHPEALIYLLWGSQRTAKLSLTPSINPGCYRPMWAWGMCSFGCCSCISRNSFSGMLIVQWVTRDTLARRGSHFRNQQTLCSRLHWPKCNVQPNNIRVWELTPDQVCTALVLSPQSGTMAALLCWALPNSLSFKSAFLPVACPVDLRHPPKS